ncbi:hypothetical protein PoB_004057600 [Plakobranchus ocellatus]|uniref:Uncharacterized protein n=1 Tax=Plakobranchus ocellatus TaxID=259542 RepID=A0AAV4B5J1_9GAST|nr:hypothetical protein PoB_004057600 [Plakobranchus ocellatus]
MSSETKSIHSPSQQTLSASPCPPRPIRFTIRAKKPYLRPCVHRDRFNSRSEPTNLICVLVHIEASSIHNPLSMQTDSILSRANTLSVLLMTQRR